VLVLVLGGCGQPAPAPGTPQARDVRPAGVRDPAPAPGTNGEVTDCGDPRASERPDPAPSGPVLDRIVQRGYLIAGVNVNAYRVGYRDPATGEMAGFEIDLVRAIAKALLGDPARVRFVAINQTNRADLLHGGEIDLAVRTTTMTCANWQDVAFSTEYYTANQRLLVRSGDPATEIEQLGGRKVCAAVGSTSLDNIRTFNPRAVPVSAQDVVDCLVLLQQHQVDAISTSDILLAALAEQDPNTVVVGRALKQQPYGISVEPGARDLLRFVNGVLERIRADGTWTASYAHWLSPILGPPPAPPPARYWP
jgi:polar amino acid transport system substrate-binding protein